MKFHVSLSALAFAALMPITLYATATSEELVRVLNGAVERARAGDFNEAMRITNAVAVNPKSPTEVMDQASKLQEIYRSVERLGQFDAIEQVSMRYVGDSFFRLRVVDKRAEGVILWTFIGYRFKDAWYCEGMSIAANSDLKELMRKELDAADVRD